MQETTSGSDRAVMLTPSSSKSTTQMDRSAFLCGERRVLQFLKEDNAQQESDLAVFSKQAQSMSNDDLRHEILRDHTKRMELLKTQYEEQLTELFFLQNGGNMMDLLSWKRKPNRQRDEFMNQNPLVDEEDVSASQPKAEVQSTSWSGQANGAAPVTGTTRTAEGAGEINGKKLSTMPPPTKPFHGLTAGDPEDAQRARQESQISARIVELNREGLLASRRLPLVHEPPRCMTHWDYMLSEMQWLAADFHGERRWKIAAAKKLGEAVLSFHRQQVAQKQRAQAELCNRLKYIASCVAKEVDTFWKNMREVVQFRRDCFHSIQRLAVWEDIDHVSEGPVAAAPTDCAQLSPMSSGSSFGVEGDLLDDLDDERSIEQVEDEMDVHAVSMEVEELQRESHLSLQDVLRTIPASYLVDNLLSSESDVDDEGLTSEHLAGTQHSSDGNAPASEDHDVKAALRTAISSAEQVREQMVDQKSLKEDDKLHLKLLRCSLLDYQVVGQKWLSAMKEQGLNAILADEPGLDMAIQAVAFLGASAFTGDWGPHLLVVPPQQLALWETKLKSWCPRLKVLSYFGSERERRLKRMNWTIPNAFHVCITSWNVLLQEPFCLQQQLWKCHILSLVDVDEASLSESLPLLASFACENRICLSSWPLKGGTYLETLVHLLLPQVFVTMNESESYLSEPNDSDNLHSVTNLLQPFVLQRHRADVLGQLPTLVEHVLACQLSPRQQQLYKAILNSAEIKASDGSEAVVNILQLVHRLRLVCNHPDLLESQHPPLPMLLEDIVLHLPSLVISPVLTEVHGSIPEDFNLSSQEEFDSWAAFRTRQLEVTRQDEEAFSNDTEAQRRDYSDDCCPSWKGISRRRLHRQPVYGGDVCSLLERFCRKRCWTIIDDHDDADFYTSHRTLVDGCLVSAPPGHNWPCDTALQEATHCVQRQCEQLSPLLQRQVSVSRPVEALPLRVEGVDLQTPSSSVDSSLLERVMRVAPHIPCAHVQLRHLCHDSGKLQKLESLIEQSRADQKRVLLLAVMPGTCDFLLYSLRKRGISCVRIDSGLSPGEQQVVVEHFNSRLDLVLIAACQSVHLGEVAANTVISYDVDWKVSSQMSTKSLLGQLSSFRDVNYYQLVCEHTIEERLLFYPDWFVDGMIRAISAAGLDQEFLQHLFLCDEQHSSDLPVAVEDSVHRKEGEKMLSEVERNYIDGLDGSVHYSSDWPLLPVFSKGSNCASLCNHGGEPCQNSHMSAVELYAIRFLESLPAICESQDDFSLSWEKQHALKQAVRECHLSPGPRLTFSQSEEEFFAENEGPMMVWLPPSPPADENDVYLSMDSLMAYQAQPMTDNQLPSRRSDIEPPAKRRRLSIGVPRIAGVVRDPPPTSLFHRKSIDSHKSRKAQKKFKSKSKNTTSASVIKGGGVPHDQPLDTGPGDWSSREDWAMIDVAANLQQMASPMTSPMPAHLPNWDFLAHSVNSVSRVHRKKDQCTVRYYHSILPREEGKDAEEGEGSRKARHKMRSQLSARSGDCAISCHMALQDRGWHASRQQFDAFSLLLQTASKQQPPVKPLLIEPFQTNPKHVEVLQDNCISTEKAMPPNQLAQVRLDRQQREEQQKQREKNVTPGAPGATMLSSTSPSANIALARVGPVHVPSTKSTAAGLNPLVGVATSATSIGQLRMPSMATFSTPQNKGNPAFVSGPPGTVRPPILPMGDSDKMRRLIEQQRMLSRHQSTLSQTGQAVSGQQVTSSNVLLPTVNSRGVAASMQRPPVPRAMLTAAHVPAARPLTLTPAISSQVLRSAHPASNLSLSTQAPTLAQRPLTAAGQQITLPRGVHLQAQRQQAVQPQTGGRMPTAVQPLGSLPTPLAGAANRVKIPASNAMLQHLSEQDLLLLKRSMQQQSQGASQPQVSSQHQMMAAMRPAPSASPHQIQHVGHSAVATAAIKAGLVAAGQTEHVPSNMQPPPSVSPATVAQVSSPHTIELASSPPLPSHTPPSGTPYRLRHPPKG